MRSIRVWWLALAVSLVLVPLGQAQVQVRVTPTNLAWTAQDWVEVVITNLPSLGATVRLSLYTDTVGTGTISTVRDYPLLTLDLKDGVTDKLGSPTIVDDQDGVSNRAVRARVSYYGVSSITHLIGRYVWHAVSGTSTGTAPFAVTQPTNMVWIEGRVRNLANSNAVPGAIVSLYPFSRVPGYAPMVLANTAGLFRIDLPSGYSPCNVAGVMAYAPGFFTAERDASGKLFSAAVFTQALAVGANVITQSLWVAPRISGQLHSVSGRLYRTDGVASQLLAGAWAMFETEEEDNDTLSLAVSGTNGWFTLPVPAGFTGYVSVMAEPLAPRGLVGLSTDWITVTNNTNLGRIDVWEADVLARALVRDANTGAGVPGVEVFFESWFGDSAAGYTQSNGYYYIGILSESDYDITLDDDNLHPLGYLGAEEEYRGTTVGTSALFTNAPFTLRKGYRASGAVFNQNTNALTGGGVGAYPYPSYFAWWEYNADPDLCGQFQMLAPTGVFAFVADGFPGYLGQTYRNHFLWEWDNGPVADPVTVTTAGVSGINFYLPRAAYIRGVVRGGGLPMADVEVSAHENWEWRAGAATGANGAYELAVPAGTNYVVRAAPDPSTFRLTRFYNGRATWEEADPVATFADQPATNIDFDLPKGGVVSGTFFLPDGVTPLTNTWGLAALMTTNDWEERVSEGYLNKEDGTYGVVAPDGVYRVWAEADGWLSQYYKGVYRWQRAQAATVTVAVEQVVSNINFVMKPPSFIEGAVRDASGPVEGIHVDVQYLPDLNERWNREWIQGDETRTDGTYSVMAPPCSNLLVQVNRDAERFYPDHYWSNALSLETATLLKVGVTQRISNIDFNLVRGYRVEGAVFQSASLTPLLGAHVRALDAADRQYDAQDANGFYELLVPTNPPLYFHAFSWSDDHVGEFFDNVYDFADATSVQAPAMTTVRVDFVLYGRWEDHDGDGLYDWQEDSRPDGRYNPAQDWASYTNRDTDGNGVTDFEEWIARTDPKNSNDYLRCATVTFAGPTAVIAWASAPGFTNYWVQRADDVKTGNWQPWLGPVTATGGITRVHDTNAPAGSFYRVRIPY